MKDILCIGTKESMYLVYKAHLAEVRNQRVKKQAEEAESKAVNLWRYKYYEDSWFFKQTNKYPVLASLFGVTSLMSSVVGSMYIYEKTGGLNLSIFIGCWFIFISFCFLFMGQERKRQRLENMKRDHPVEFNLLPWWVRYTW